MFKLWNSDHNDSGKASHLYPRPPGIGEGNSSMGTSSQQMSHALLQTCLLRTDKGSCMESDLQQF